MNPYENIPSRPVKVEEKKTNIHSSAFNSESMVSLSMGRILPHHPSINEDMRKYTVWAAGLLKRFFYDGLWDVMEIMEKWAEDSSSVTTEQLNQARSLAKKIVNSHCTGHFWIYDKNSVAAIAVYRITQFDVDPSYAMDYIEQVHKLDVEYRHEIITLRNNIISCRSIAQLDFDPNRSQYQMLQEHQRAKIATSEYEKALKTAIDEARIPQWEMYEKTVLRKIS